MKKLIELHFKYKYIIFILIVLLSLFGASKAPKIPINLALEKLLPDDNISVIEMNKVSNEIGGIGHLNILIGPMDHPEQYLESIANKLQTLKDVKYLFYHKEYYSLKDKVLYLIDDQEFSKLRKNAKILFREGQTGMLNLGLEDENDKKRNIEKAKDFFKKFKGDYESEEFFLSKNKQYALLMVKPNFESVDLERSESFTTQVSDLIKTVLKDKPFRLMGRYVEKVKDTRQIERDIKKTGLISAILIILCLILGLGSFRSTLFIFMGVSLALGITSISAYFLVGQINILTGFLVAILAGMGADYGIHLIRRFYQELESGKTKESALMHTYIKTGRALFSSAFSTAIAFLCLIISDFRGFSELGIIAGTGILSVWLVFILTFPVIGEVLGPKVRFTKTSSLFNFFPFKSSHLKYLVILIPIIIYGVFQSEFEYNFNRMRNLSNESNFLENLIDELYGKSTSPVGILATDKSHAKEIMEFVQDKKYDAIVNSAVSLSTVLPDNMDYRFRRIKKLKKLLKDTSDQEIKEKSGLDAKRVRDMLNTRPYELKDLPPHLSTTFGQSGKVVLLYPQKVIDNKQALYELANLLKEIKEKFPKAIIGSDTLVFAEIIEHIITDGRIITLIFLIGVFFIFVIDNKSFKAALVLEVQIVSGIIFLIGLMGLFGVRFTIINVSIFPAVLAIGIDMGVHIFHREQEGWHSLRSAKLSAHAIQLSLVTTLFGFGSLLLTEAKILQDIGWLAVLGMIGMYLICMVLWPLINDRFFLKHKGH